MRLRIVGIGVVIAALLAVGTAPAAAERAVPANCANGDARWPVRLGPLSWLSDVDSYETWDGSRGIDEDGIFYAKRPMRLRRGAVASIALAPRSRQVADVFYNGRRGDALRLRSCDDVAAFFSGGFLVTGRACVTFAVRARGSRRVYRETASIGMGDAC